jgi:hypothetical protein
VPQVTYPCVCALSIINHVHSLQRDPFPRFQRSLSPCVNTFRPAGSLGRSEGGTASNSAKRGRLDSSGQLSAPTEIYSTMPWRFGTGREERQSSFQDVKCLHYFKASSPATIPDNIGHVPGCVNCVNNAAKQPFV